MEIISFICFIIALVVLLKSLMQRNKKHLQEIDKQIYDVRKIKEMVKEYKKLTGVR